MVATSQGTWLPALAMPPGTGLPSLPTGTPVLGVLGASGVPVVGGMGLVGASPGGPFTSEPRSLPPPSLAALHAMNNQTLHAVEPIVRCETMTSPVSFVFRRDPPRR